MTVCTARSALPLNPGSFVAPANAAVAGLLVEQRRGTEAAKIVLVAGFNRMSQEGRSTTPPPAPGDVLN